MSCGSGSSRCGSRAITQRSHGGWRVTRARHPPALPRTVACLPIVHSPAKRVFNRHFLTNSHHHHPQDRLLVTFDPAIIGWLGPRLTERTSIFGNSMAWCAHAPFSRQRGRTYSPAHSPRLSYATWLVTAGNGVTTRYRSGDMPSPRLGATPSTNGDSRSGSVAGASSARVSSHSRTRIGTTMACLRRAALVASNAGPHDRRSRANVVERGPARSAGGRLRHPHNVPTNAQPRHAERSPSLQGAGLWPAPSRSAPRVAPELGRHSTGL